MKAPLTVEAWLDEVTRPFPLDTARKLRREFEAHIAQDVEAAGVDRKPSNWRCKR